MSKHRSLEFADATTLTVYKRGLDLINDPILNKGSGFPDSERGTLGIRGLVPPDVVSIDDQVQRVMGNYRLKTNDLDRYVFLEELHSRNETLYYRVLLEHIQELTPIVYTPTVGQACRQFGHIYRRARGMYFSARDRDYFGEMVANWPEDGIDIVVVTDGSRILGLGDLGSNGMGIPIGKLALYVAGAGIHPQRTLPVMLDVGTNNRDLRDDVLYLGERIPRLPDPEYCPVVEAFIQAIRSRWPKALIQFEDFSNNHAFPLLEHYRERILCFNDDIQGTGAVTLAGLLSALRITQQPITDQRVLFLGAGSAARGIADMLAAGFMEEGGLTREQARARIWMVDSKGLVTRDRFDSLDEHKRPYAQDQPPCNDFRLLVENIRPTVLIGVSGQANAFSEEVLTSLGKQVERPIVFALSNPTSKAECTAEQAYRHTDGRAIFASGSPFPPITIDDRFLVPGQCNNMYIFPGVGMGAITAEASQVTDRMFYVAARALADQVSEDALSVGNLYPDLKNIREISAHIAARVCEVAFQQGIAGIEPVEDLLPMIHRRMFQPVYHPYRAG